MTIEKFATLLGILATIIGGIYFIVKEFKKYQLRFRKKLQKKWTNEGDVTSLGKLSHFIYIEINTDVEDGEIKGIIESRSLTSENAIKNVSMNGKLFYKSAIVTLSDFKRGQLMKYGKARLTIKGNNIHWKLLKGDKNYFPTSAIMWMY